MSNRSLELRQHIVKPVLQTLELYSLAAENLLIGTCAVESNMGEYLRQRGGPALGIWQMEPPTHDDIWRNFLRYKTALAEKVQRWTIYREAPEMVWNTAYACAMARVHYLRAPTPLPAADDVPALARYWKKHYNTELGKGRVEDFVAKYDSVR